MPQRNKKIVLFLGAGASAAFSFPTTKKMFEIIIEGLEDDLFTLLSKLKITYNIEDVEPIYTLLEKYMGRSDEEKVLDDFYKTTANIAFSLKDKEIKKEYNRVFNLFEKDIEKLFYHIQEEVYNAYIMTDEKEAEIVNYYDPLFNLLHLYDHQEIHIFTTNYEQVIEKLFKNKQLYHEYILVDGFSVFEDSHQDFTWHPNNFEKEFDKKKFNLYKLHGSLTWIKKPEGQITRLSLEELYRIAPHISNVLLYPGDEKSGIDHPPFDTLHDQLLKQLSNADICVFIGFALRDKEINKIIINSIRNNTSLKLLIINKDSDFVAKQLANKIIIELRSEGILWDNIEVIGEYFGTDKLLTELKKSKLLTKHLQTGRSRQRPPPKRRSPSL